MFILGAIVMAVVVLVLPLKTVTGIHNKVRGFFNNLSN